MASSGYEIFHDRRRLSSKLIVRSSIPPLAIFHHHPSFLRLPFTSIDDDQAQFIDFRDFTFYRFSDTRVLAAKRATGFNYSTIQLQQYSITAEFNYIPQHYNQPNRALGFLLDIYGGATWINLKTLSIKNMFE
ncbi:hypothetical protein LXL04_024719 [Taraxacum kok-saghyz]